MPAPAMFSKFKASTNTTQHHNPLDNNPIVQLFDIGKQTGAAGPGLIWRIHDGKRKSDGKDVSIFVFEKRLAEKLHKPKRKDTVCEVLRGSVRNLERFRHPKILQVIHTAEECNDTLAFATEPVLASLASVLAFQEAGGGGMGGGVGGLPATGASHPNQPPPRPPLHARQYEFLDIEIKYGILQLVEALSFLHTNQHVLHRNVCPASIFITKRGTWKLAGLEFTERVNDDAQDIIQCQPWTSRMSKLTQPDLDYIAPECQMQSVCSTLSDMYSLGMVITAIYNNGRPLIQASHSNSNYLKQLDVLDEQVINVRPRIPIPIQEAVTRLLSKEPSKRPNAQLLTLLQFFNDPGVQALQFMDVINMKDPGQKTEFYKTTLRKAMKHIPRKLWFQHMWPCLEQEMRTQEVLAAVLKPIILLINECTTEEYETKIQKSLRSVLSMPKSIQATVVLLENLHILLEKTTKQDARTDILRVLYNAFENTTIQVQSAALYAVTNVSEYLDEAAIRQSILPRTVAVFQQNQNDLKFTHSVLYCVERILDRLDRPLILDQVLPLLGDVRINDPDILYRVVCIYRVLLSDKKYGLTVNIMATRVMPVLLPQTVNPQLNLDQFTSLLEVLKEMLDQIDRNQRNKLKLDDLPSPDRHRPLRHLHSSENMRAPPFNIPNLRIEQRKTSSAEDMARKNSTDSGVLSSWWYGGSPSSPDQNLLRVHQNLLPTRRLSDNTLMTPKIRVGASSSVSSPGGGSPLGLPFRRHSSFGPQERRGSTINLSPPAGAGYYHGSVSREGSTLSVPSVYGGSMPNTSSSVPFLLSSSMQSLRSRRTSTCISGTQGSNLLQQLGSGMVRQLTGSPQHPANGRAGPSTSNCQLFSGRS